jgi:hypothetical protein
MKKAIVIAAMMLVMPMVSMAAEKDDPCKVYGGLAEAIMRGHQVGVPMVEMMAISTDESIKQMVILAYESPRYQTPEIQRRTIGDFRDSAYLACAKSARR